MLCMAAAANVNNEAEITMSFTSPLQLSGN